MWYNIHLLQQLFANTHANTKRDDSDSYDDSVTVDDHCDVLYQNVDVDELSMDLASVNGSNEESVATLSILSCLTNISCNTKSTI